MNLEDGINQLSQLFKSANACMERNDYRAAINYHNKIIELVQILRKPFDNGEVPLNVVTEVFPKILQAEKAARDAMAVAQLGIDAQKKSAENQATINISQPQNDNAKLESISTDDLKQFTQHIQAASDYMEKGDYNSVIAEYNKALDRIRILQFLLIKQADNYPANQFLKTMEKITNAEIDIHKGLFVAYFKIGNNEKAGEEQKAIDTLTHSNNSDVEQYTQHMLTANDYMEKGDYNSAIAEYNKALDRIRILQSDTPPIDLNITTAEFDVHTGLFVAYSKIGNKEKAAEEQKAMDTLTYSQNNTETPISPQNQYNAQSSGCFSTIFVMCVVLSMLIFVW